MTKKENRREITVGIILMVVGIIGLIALYLLTR